MIWRHLSMKILIINGPNLNFLGIREPEIYGKMTYQELCTLLIDYGKSHKTEILVKQTNEEGKIIDFLQEAHFDSSLKGIILNAGAYTHYSYAIHDAIKAINKPVIEVHLSDPNLRDEFRHLSVIKPVCLKTFKGEGIKSYYNAIDYLEMLNESK